MILPNIISWTGTEAQYGETLVYLLNVSREESTSHQPTVMSRIRGLVM